MVRMDGKGDFTRNADSFGDWKKASENEEERKYDFH